MASIVQNKSPIRADRAEEIRTESHDETDNSAGHAGRREAFDLRGIEEYRLQKSQVRGRGGEYESVLSASSDPGGRAWMINRQAESEKPRLIGRRPQPVDELSDVSEVDVLLENHEAIEFHDPDLARHDAEGALKHRVG